MSNNADWDRIADTYVSLAGTPGDRAYQQLQDALWDSFGDLRGRRVLDIGCGHGWLTKLIAESGATVVGVDGSDELLRRARESSPNVEFHAWDLTIGLPGGLKGFDRAIAHMVLMDLPEIGSLLASIRDSLKHDGKFVFTMPHPCFFNYKALRNEEGRLVCGVSGYLEPASWWIETFGGHWHYHRSLTAYFEELRKARFAVTRLYEPPTIAASPDQAELLKAIPKFILIEAVPR